MIGSIRPRRALKARLAVWLERHLQSLLATLGTFWRAPGAALLTSGVIMVALLVPFSIFLLVDGARTVAGRWQGAHQMSVFLRPEMEDERARELARRLQGRPDIAATRVITREQALEEFRAAMGVTGLVESLGEENPLPAVVVVTPASGDAHALRALAAAIGDMSEVELVQLDEVWVERLGAMLELAERVLVIAAAVLGAGVLLVVGNTLRLTIETRRSEIEVEKLFGASDAFVRRPFLYHGLLYGLSGAVMACVTLYLAVALLGTPVARLASLYGQSLSLPLPSKLQTLALLGIGGGLGLLGSWLSVGRHLKRIEPR